jgi:2'-5' RNA ligase
MGQGTWRAGNAMKYYGVAKPKHDFSNTQIPITGWHSAAMRQMANAIQGSHLQAEKGASFGGSSSATGRETEHHVTVKYGLSDNAPPARLKKALAGFGPVKAKFGKTSLFKNDDSHVLKIDIDSPDLHRLNKLIGRTVETPGNTHPAYSPHATVAYLKPEHSAKYKDDGRLNGQEFTIDHVVFSGKDGARHIMPLGVKKTEYRSLG